MASWSRRIAPVAVLLLACLTMAPVVSNDFTTWDDDRTIARNPHLNPPTRSGLSHHWTHEHMHLWVPVTYSVWAGLAWVSHAAWDTNQPAAFHAASVVGHAGAALVVFLLVRRLARNDWAALAGAAVFAVHPVQVETVAWASGLKDVLCGLLTWTAVWQYVCFADEREGPPRRKWLHYTLATIAFVLAMLSKPTAVVAPLLAGVIDLWVLRRPLKRVATVILPWLVLALPCVAWTRHVQPPQQIAPHVPWHMRPLVALDALAFYLRQLVWPGSLGIDYGRRPDVVIERGWVWYTWIAPATVAAGAVLVARRWRLAAAGGATLAIGVAPVLGFQPFDFQFYSTVADHYLYLGLGGVALIVADVARRLRPRVAFAVAAPLVLLLVVRSWVQTSQWQTSVSLFTHALQVNPDSFVAHNSLAAALLTGEDVRPNPVVAERHARRATQLKPEHAPAYVTLGAALAAQDRLPEALEAYHHAVRLDAGSARAHANLGGLLAAAGRRDAALTHLREALRLDPLEPQAHLNLGTLLAATDPSAALTHLAEAVRLAPRNALARVNYGYVLLDAGMKPRAAEQFRAALSLDPGSAPARAGLEQATAIR